MTPDGAAAFDPQALDFSAAQLGAARPLLELRFQRWTRALSVAFAGVTEHRGRHDPGRVIRDLAVMLADGGDCPFDLRLVRDQDPFFGAVASDTTAFRLIDRITTEPKLLDALRTARATARERAWELGAHPKEVEIDVDATLIGAHSEKEGAAGTFNGGFGFHPMLAFLAGSRESLAGLLRRVAPVRRDSRGVPQILGRYLEPPVSLASVRGSRSPMTCRRRALGCCPVRF